MFGYKHSGKDPLTHPMSTKSDPAKDKTKSVKAIKTYDQVRNTVMEAGTHTLENVSQVLSNLKKKPPAKAKALPKKGKAKK